jgi:hypothetical protein
MKFQVNQLKIEQLVGYFNDSVIDLSPPFQRGRVWTLKMRQELLRNIIAGKPVPAIFLYKAPRGPKNYFSILDGKQRLESVLLYIASERPDLQVNKWSSYIYGAHRKHASFKALVNGEKKSIADLSNPEIVAFRDYPLSIIEIDFNEDEVSLEDIIQLFVDINQTGVKVTRFDIVKALCRKAPLLKQIFELIAIEQKRQGDVMYKLRSTPFCKVLQNLEIVRRLEEKQNRVDLMWERLCEIALFASSRTHRKPSEMLKDFISKKGNTPQKKLSSTELWVLRTAFNAVVDLEKNDDFLKTRWATDQTHFYILISFLILETRDGQQAPSDFGAKLIKVDALMAGQWKGDAAKKTQDKVREYARLSEKQTTDVQKRGDRIALFRELMGML